MMPNRLQICLFAILSIGLLAGVVWGTNSQPEFNNATIQDSKADSDTGQDTENATTASITDEAKNKPEGSNKKTEEDLDEEKTPPLLTNDAVIFGILMVILGFVFWSSNCQLPAFKAFYKFIPMLLMCYFLPSLLTLFNVVDAEESKLYHVASRYLLPASLVLLTLSIDLKEIMRLGPKALIMFFVGTVGVILGGPLAILIISFINPEWVGGVGPDAVWRGLTTVAGSWIGGGANQVAMKEVFEVGEKTFTAMVAVDILVAEFWMMFLLLGVGNSKAIDRFLKADASSIDRLQQKMEKFQQKTLRITTTTDMVVIGAIAFGATALAHFGAELLGPFFGRLGASNKTFSWVLDFSLQKEFFWIVLISTTSGVLLSFTKLKTFEGAGASKVGTVFIFILVAVIGMKMDIRAVVEYKELFLVGLIWMVFHVGLLFLVAWLIRAPYFFLAVGSKANIGGAASAPVVAAAFHPALAPVGVLLAVLGYALGTYGAMVCGWLMQQAAP